MARKMAYEANKEEFEAHQNNVAIETAIEFVVGWCEERNNKAGLVHEAHR